ncbi:MAG: hypothetical protein JWM66_8 [Solirubrobacterales bacterium]|nr:hypothetical protein [Solirubrobacterales bacterium]
MRCSVDRVRQIVLLRAVNVGGRNKLPMPALRAALEHAGMREVVSYVQSGNVVLDSDATPAELAERCERVIAREFALQLDVLARTRTELASIVERDPLGDVAVQEKLYQVTFCAQEPAKDAVDRIGARAEGGERLVADGREVFAWFPNGVGRSKLAARLGSRDLGVVATARNWTTVKKLLELASD